MDRLWRVLRFCGRHTRRLVILVAGLAVMTAGAVMLVTPGPGWAAIFVGLAILATEFAWAERLLERCKRRALDVRDRAVSGFRRRRRSRAAAALAKQSGQRRFRPLFRRTDETSQGRAPGDSASSASDSQDSSAADSAA